MFLGLDFLWLSGAAGENYVWEIGGSVQVLSYGCAQEMWGPAYLFQGSGPCYTNPV